MVRACGACSTLIHSWPPNGRGSAQGSAARTHFPSDLSTTCCLLLPRETRGSPNCPKQWTLQCLNSLLGTFGGPGKHQTCVQLQHEMRAYFANYRHLNATLMQRCDKLSSDGNFKARRGGLRQRYLQTKGSMDTTELQTLCCRPHLRNPKYRRLSAKLLT